MKIANSLGNARLSGIGKYIYRVLVRYSKSEELRVTEVPANWTVKLREIFDDEDAIQQQEETTAQEEMRFGEREPAQEDRGIERS